MGHRNRSATPNHRTALQELLTFIEEHGDTPLERSEADRLFDLDLQTGAECKRLRIEIPKPDSTCHTAAMNLAYGRESVYLWPGNLDLAGPGNFPDYLRLILTPQEDWLNWLRAVCRSLSVQRQDKPVRRRAGFAAKIESLKRELKDHLLAARNCAYATKDETGTPKLLPRPTQKELAERAKMKPWDVSRCLKDEDAAELRLYWDIAADVDRIMSFSPL